MADTWEPYVEWDKPGDHIYETGIDRCMLYVCDTKGRYKRAGVPWSGIISIQEKNTGGTSEDLFADDVKYMAVRTNENFGLTIKAYTYPAEFAQCIGEYELVNGITVGQQTHRQFGLSYRTKIGNEIVGDSYAYKLHLVYGCVAQPVQRDFKTINADPEATEFTWDVACEGLRASGYRPIAEITIDTYRIMYPLISDEDASDDINLFNYLQALKLSTLERRLYGTKPGIFDIYGKEPELPTVYEIVGSFLNYAANINGTVGVNDEDESTEVDDWDEQPNTIKKNSDEPLYQALYKINGTQKYIAVTGVISDNNLKNTDSVILHLYTPVSSIYLPDDEVILKTEIKQGELIVLSEDYHFIKKSEEGVTSMLHFYEMFPDYNHMYPEYETTRENYLRIAYEKYEEVIDGETVTKEGFILQKQALYYVNS